MDGILDDSRLDGVFDVGTALRPQRRADLVPAHDLNLLMQRIEFHCQVWGGGGSVLVPFVGGALEGTYEAELVRSDVDYLDTHLFGEEVECPPWIGHRAGLPFPALLIADGMTKRDEWWPFRVADLPDEDPWKPIYAATIGLWPKSPSADLFPSWAFQAPPESFEMFFQVERQSPTGSLDDLANRLTERASHWPRTLSLLGLASGTRPHTGYIASDTHGLPIPEETKIAAGPNIVVVFGEQPASDAALLWNLRGAHASGYALPIGIPRRELDPAALTKLRQPGMSAAFGLSGGQIYLTSTTVPFEELSALAALHAGFRAAPYQELLSFGPAPAIPHNQVATFTDGRARLVPETESDIKLIRPYGRQQVEPNLQLDVTVDRDPVPSSRTLRGGSWGPRFAAGSALLQVPGRALARTRSVEVEWPTPWLRLQCVAKDHGLQVEVSEAGHASLALIEALGGVHQIRWLAHPGLMRLIYRLAERSGMSWWKSRWTAARKEIGALGIDEAAFDELARTMGRDETAVAPAGEGRELAFQQFVDALDKKERAASNWIGWAERHHLVVRGAEVRCDKCRARSWHPVTATPPSVVTCPGCGRSIAHPFPPRQLQFSYRLGEVLRRALELDCLDHLFALHYFHLMFRERNLVGIHPGVNFNEVGSTTVVAEADVLLLFADAAMVPGEVKRTGAGVTGDALDKLSATADRLTAPWSFFAVGQAARECHANVSSAAMREGAQPRLVVTTDQTFDPDPLWTVGNDPFAWAPRTDEEDSQRSEAFVSLLRDRSPDDPWRSQDSSLLRDWE